MTKLQQLSKEQLKALLLKELYGYSKDWYSRFLKKRSDVAWKEFNKAKTLIKEIEDWQDQSLENFKLLKGGTHTYNDFVSIKKQTQIHEQLK